MNPLSGSPRFGRVVTAMVTPFDDSGALAVLGVYWHPADAWTVS